MVLPQGDTMTTAKLFQNGRSQAVRLPKEFRFDDNEDEVIIKKVGKAVILISKSELKNVFLGSLDKFPDDFEIERDRVTPTREVSL
jgi:antitoxin VapB